MKQLGIIGIGNMGYAILNGMLKHTKAEDILFTDVKLARMEQVKAKTGVNYTTDIKELVSQCKYLLFAVKPQYIGTVLKEVRGCITTDNVVLSIVAGIPIVTFKQELGEEIKVVRSMPNTPALVEEGMTAVCFSEDSYTTEEVEDIKKIYSSFGVYEILDEKLMNAAICANGSSPAYVYMFMEALADSVVKYGIPRDMAYRLVGQTVLGSAKMLLETKEHPGVLKDQVCSPAGTTIAAVSALEEYGFRNAIIKATDACYAKAESLKK